MAYSVEADIKEIISDEDLIQLTDDVAPVDTIDSALVSAAIDRADNKINGYLRGKQNPLPLSPVPPLIKDISVSLAVFQLYRRRPNVEIPDPVERDLKMAVKDLEGIRDGKILIADPGSPAQTASFYKGSGAEKGVLLDSNCDGTGSLDPYYQGPL